MPNTKCRKHVASLQGDAVWCACDGACPHGEADDYAGAPTPWWPDPTPSQAMRDVMAERLRQVHQEGWTPQHDDGHARGEMATAAGWYALNANSHAYNDVAGVGNPDSITHRLFCEADGFYRWPWAISWWKPKDRRRDLVRAGALIVAEIERLDRAAAKTTT